MAAPAPGASFPMDSVTAEKEIYQLVSSSDLSDLTSAKVRSHLEEQFGMDFTPYKARVNEMTRLAIEKMQKNKKKSKVDSDSSDDDDSDHEERKEEINNGKNIKKEESSSDTDSDPGILSTDRKKKTKKSSNASKTKVKIENDPPVASKNFEDMVSNIKSSRRAAASKAMKDIRRSAGPGAGIMKKPKDKDKDEDFSGKFGRMTKLCYISAELQEIVGNQYMKRCDVVKAIWDYVKANDLKDPKQKQFVRCDEKLEVVFKRKRFKAFGMTKFLMKHVMNPKEMGPEYVEEANNEMKRLKEEWLERKRLREEAGGNNDDEPDTKKIKQESVDEEEKKAEEEKEDDNEDDSDDDSD